MVQEGVITGRWLCAGMSTFRYTCMGLWGITVDTEGLAAWGFVCSKGWCVEHCNWSQ